MNIGLLIDLVTVLIASAGFSLGVVSLIRTEKIQKELISYPALSKFLSEADALRTEAEGFIREAMKIAQSQVAQSEAGGSSYKSDIIWNKFVETLALGMTKYAEIDQKYRHSLHYFPRKLRGELNRKSEELFGKISTESYAKPKENVSADLKAAIKYAESTKIHIDTMLDETRALLNRFF